jgi:hypothetical protein
MRNIEFHTLWNVSTIKKVQEKEQTVNILRLKIRRKKVKLKQKVLFIEFSWYSEIFWHLNIIFRNI